MNCTDFEPLLEPFHDGELEGRLMRNAAMHLAACEPCSALLARFERVQALLAESTDQDAGQVDVDRIWAGVEQGLAEEPPGQQGGWQPLRLAAATTNLRGIGPRAGRGENDAGRPDVDEAEAVWLRAEEPSPQSAVAGFFGGGMALAAGVLLALLVFGGGNQAAGPEVAVRPPAAGAARDVVRAVAAKAAQSAPTVVAAAQRAGRNEAVRQVQIHSLNDFGGEMAMWAAPAGDTAVIWLGDGAPRARR